jgi:hypothetical protein
LLVRETDGVNFSSVRSSFMSPSGLLRRRKILNHPQLRKSFNTQVSSRFLTACNAHE